MPTVPREESPVRDRSLLERVLASGRIHSGFLISGAPGAARAAALEFARGIACRGEGRRPCGACRDCRLSAEEGREVVEIDGSGRRGPLYRHVGDHPDLYLLERDADSTRVRIGQVRAVQQALRLGASEGGWRVVVIADAEWLNVEAQNALLRLLEEPPERSCLVLATASAAGLLATIRSRCQRVVIHEPLADRLRGEGVDDDVRELADRLDAIGRRDLPDLLDWAEEYRGVRAVAAAKAQTLVATGSEWLRQRVKHAVHAGASDVGAELDAFHVLASCRKELAQRNANPQMVAERALFALREAVARSGERA